MRMTNVMQAFSVHVAVVFAVALSFAAVSCTPQPPPPDLSPGSGGDADSDAGSSGADVGSSGSDAGYREDAADPDNGKEIDAGDGQETDTGGDDESDDCEPACGSSEVCEQGECVCRSGYTDCQGECVDTDAHAEHCGSCNDACGSLEVCDGGTCRDDCSAGRIVCDGSCVDTDASELHCGTCDNACETDIDGAVPVCDGGDCTEECLLSAYSVCEQQGVCANLEEDADNCGSCGHECTTDIDGAVGVCVDGKCADQCVLSAHDVCEGQGVCTDLDSDNNNCGYCGNVCTGMTYCEGGFCQTPEERTVFVGENDYSPSSTHILRLDHEGDEVWAVPMEDLVAALVIDPDLNIYVGTTTNSAGPATSWLHFRGYNSSGTQMWEESYADNWVRDVAVNADENRWLSNRHDGVRHYNSFGSLQWEYEPPSGIRALAVDADNYSYGARFDGWLTKIDPDGDAVWHFSEHDDELRDVAVDTDGYVYSASEDHTVRKIDADGEEVWIFDGHDDTVTAVDVDADGYVYSASLDHTIRKIDADGNEVWVFDDYDETDDFNNHPQVLVVDPEGFVYAGAQDGTVRKIHPQNVEVWETELETNFVGGIDVEPGRYAAFPDEW